MNTITAHQKDIQTFVGQTTDEKIMPPTADVDVRVAQMYRVLSFCGKEKPILDEFISCFTAGALLINNTHSNPVRLSVPTFVRLFRSQVHANEVPPFYVKEINYQTEQFGNIAQRFSIFEICYYDKDIENQKGVSSIQLLFINGDWKINAMTWQEETSALPIPARLR